MSSRPQTDGQDRAALAARGLTRTTSSRNPGDRAAKRPWSSGSASASAKRMRAAQAEDSATTVIRPFSKLQRFTLFASSFPSTFITVTCHSDASGAERARWRRAGRRAEIKSPAVLGLVPERVVCLFREGLLGIVSRLLGLTVMPVKNSHRERTTRMPASLKSLKHIEEGRKGPLCPMVPELAR
jgi:hypothetical protein